MQKENADAKKELLARGIPLPGSKEPPQVHAPAIKRDFEIRLPDEADLARVRAFVDRLWRHLLDTIAEMQKDVWRKT